MTGVVDFASNTTEGLKNTALYYEDKPNDNRIRYPRVFYTKMGQMREYNLIDCKLYGIINLPKHKSKHGFENTIFMDSFITNDKKIVVMLMKHIVMISFDEEEVEWSIDF